MKTKDLKTYLSMIEDKVNKEKDKLNRDMADRWEYLSGLDLELKKLKKELKARDSDE